jgi:hypothetical protein
LATQDPQRIAQFRRQVEVIDWAGEEDLQALEAEVGGLVARNPGRLMTGDDVAGMDERAGMPQAEEQFIAIRPGGVREPLQYDPKGYFVITLDRQQEQISLRHYLPNHAPAHEMRGRSAGPMVLGLLREGLVTQLSHAGYLGAELAKAEAALRFDLRYDQDRPLRRREASVATQDAPSQVPEAPAPAAATTTPIAAITLPLTAAELAAATLGAAVNVALALTGLPAPDRLDGELLQADEAEPFNAFRRTGQLVQVRWSPATQFAMGEAADLHVGALVRARGALGEERLIEAERLVILTLVARILEG